MSDVRALLKAKRQELRIIHPLASYSSTGHLRCIACGTVIKQAASWNGHIGSKPHRINAARMREEEKRRDTQVEEEKVQGKRKADSEDVPVLPDVKKRKVQGDNDSLQTPPVTTLHRPPSSNEFPADFFSDPSKAPPPPSDDDEDMQEPPSHPTNVIDLEWEQFQQAVLNPPDARDAFERATVFAEPVLASEVPEGFPPLQTHNATEEPEEELSTEELRKRKEQDDRELIMDRLLDEERAQEEADAKVTMLKIRVDALKRRREAAKVAQAKKGA